ncbi:MAG: GNAT family N-acetyltransferase [Fimbriimonadales bacterium]
MKIRLADASDNPAFCRIFTAVWPNHQLGLGELEREFTIMPEQQRMAIWLAENEGEPVGFARIYRNIGSYDPLKWYAEIGVLPEHRGSGLGKSLYDHVLETIRAEGAVSIMGRVSDEDSCSLQFFQNRGFAEVKRDFESILHLDEIDKELLEKLDRVDVDFQPFAEVDSPEFRRNWHLLFELLRKDVPRLEPPTPFSYEQFEEIFVVDPDFLWDISQVARDNEGLIGFTYLYRSDVEAELFQALTAVHRDYRGRGIAKALKARSAKRAIEAGYKTVRADNDTRNAPMLAINDRLGYKRLPGMITLAKDLV